MLRTLSASLAAVLMGAALLWSATEGLRVFTTEGARRTAVERQPKPVPDVVLVDMNGAPVRLTGADGEPVLVEFIYTRCPTICTALGETFARLSEKIGAGEKTMKMLSVSFDLANDDEDALRSYAQIHGANGTAWNVARPANDQDLKKLLKTFKVTVIPDEYGGFEHNAAIHYVNGSGKLAGIFGLEEDSAILSKAGVVQ